MDIEVGQKWRTRDGRIAKVTEHRIGEPYPFILLSDDGVRFSITESGRESTSTETDRDLVELIGPKPWYPDDSSEWVEVPDTQMYEPVLPVGSLVKVLLRAERETKTVSKEQGGVPANWEWKGDPERGGRIVAYRVVGAQTLESTPPSAPDLLDKAAGHMRERAATYDSPGGERSMAKTVAVFNTVTGHSISEADGWLFMAALKQVRLFSNREKAHQDSMEDLVAYSALLGECCMSGGLK